MRKTLWKDAKGMGKMLYTQKEPCSNCPFRNDGKYKWQLKRANEIAEGLLNTTPFACHKTVYSKSESPPQHCAGALIILEKMKRPHVAMVLGEQLGLYDKTKLNMNAPVYDTMADFVATVQEK